MTHLSRRAMLTGLGGLIALPWLEATAGDGASAAGGGDRRDPPRLAFIYMAGGVYIPGWFPKDTGTGYTLPSTIATIARHRADFSMVSGTMHILGQVGGHQHKLNWLTGHNVLSVPGKRTNTISVDQVAAAAIGDTYLPSLVMSYAEAGGDFGVTLSRNAQGADIPPLASPRRVFERLFPPRDARQRGEIAQRLAQRRSVLDQALAELADVRSSLGIGDRRRLDEYASSVRDMERRLVVRAAYCEREQPAVDLTGIDLDRAWNPCAANCSYREWLDTMLDLLVLGFQTDMTRVATLATLDENYASYGSEWADWLKPFPKHDYLSGIHGIYHHGSGLETAPEVKLHCAKVLEQRDRLIMASFGRLLDRLAAIPARDGRLLDHCQIVLGSSQDTTHNSTNFPMLVAGGRRLGWKHGQHVRYHPRKVPTSDLYLTMLEAARCGVRAFKESRGALGELMA